MVTASCCGNSVQGFRSFLSPDLSSCLTFLSSQLHSQFPASPHCLWCPSAALPSSVFLFYLRSLALLPVPHIKREMAATAPIYLWRLFIHGDTGYISKVYMYLHVARMAGLLLEENMSKHHYSSEHLHSGRRTLCTGKHGVWFFFFFFKFFCLFI